MLAGRSAVGAALSRTRKRSRDDPERPAVLPQRATAEAIFFGCNFCDSEVALDALPGSGFYRRVKCIPSFNTGNSIYKSAAHPRESLTESQVHSHAHPSSSTGVEPTLPLPLR